MKSWLVLMAGGLGYGGQLGAIASPPPAVMSASPSLPLFVAQTLPPQPVPLAPLQPDRPDLQPLPEPLPLPPNAPLPLDPTPTVPPEPDTLPGITVEVRQVRVLGSTVFSEAELAAVVEPFMGQTATFEDLLAIRTAITDFYTRQGYTTSGAFLPPQDISEGIVTVQVVEGELEQIQIQGLQRLRESYVRDRIGLVGTTPLNLRRLETALQLLQLDPLFRSVQAELTAGTTPGRSVLVLNLQEAEAITPAVIVENRDSPSVGSFRGTFSLGHGNLLGWGDRLSAAYGLTEGIRSYDLAYVFPLNPREGTLNLRYSHSNSRIVEPPFADLGITSRANTFSVGFRQPLSRTPTQEFALGLALDLRHSQTYLFEDRPFSFSPGLEDGRSRVAVVRFSQDWLNRSPNQVLAARSQFSLGLDAFDATVNAVGPDGRFLSWLGQFQWVRALGTDTVAIARLSTQLTGDQLLPLEQFSIGGVDTVRGYRQNQRLGDSGVLGSVEVRLPIIRDRDGIGMIHLAPFVDLGHVWNSQGSTPQNILISTGLGLRWQASPQLMAQLDWGIPLTSKDQAGNTLQDQGIVFSVRLEPLRF